MKRLIPIAAVLASVVAFCADAPPLDPVLQAMRDEIERSRKIAVANLEAPYFIEYVLDQADAFSVTASLGGVISRRRNQLREPEVHVRVGDYKFDNTNFAGQGGGGSRYDLGRLPIDNSYPVLRRFFWLSTDAAYKNAVEAISRKRAALRNMNEQSTLEDFAHAPAIQHLGEFRRLAVDEDAWTSRVRALSAIFAEFPDIKDSRIEMEASAGGYYVANSEGTLVREPEGITFIRARALALAADGTAVRDQVTFHALELARLPSDAEMGHGIREMAQRLVELSRAPKGEDYSGPVLFEGLAGPQIFVEVLGKNLALPRRPEGGRGAFIGSELEGRSGARILPESFTVVDDPTQKEWRGRPLFGSYEVDREGVPGKPLTLVEKGVLKGYLLTRQPVRGFSASNGRARLPGAFGASNATTSNLFVSSSETVPAAQLKKKLIEMVQARNLPYAVIVRKMDFPSAASIDDLRRMLTSAQGTTHPVSQPILLYKVFPDGREELVRGLRFRGLNARSFKDIVAAGDDANLFELLDNAAPFALIGGSNYTNEEAVVAPSVLIDDLELHPSEEQAPKLPVVPAPELSR